MESEEESDVILADPETDVFPQLTKKYHADGNKHIEPHTWIRSCIDRDICVYSAKTYKNPGGRRAGDESVKTYSHRKHCTDLFSDVLLLMTKMN